MVYGSAKIAMTNSTLPKVAIIMPAFNAGRYIAGSIQSVLNQTQHDWQLWIVDDGSTDDTAAIVHAFQDDRLRYYRSSHLGKPGCVRNLGVHLSQSHYLAFLDADDLYHPNFLENFSQVLDEQPEIKMVYGFLSLINEVGEPVPSAGFKLLCDPGSKSGNQLPISYEHSWKRIALAQFSASTAFMIRRDFFESIGKFSDALHASEDLHFFYKAFIADREAISAFPLYAVYYRKNMNSVTRTKENLQKLLESQMLATKDFFNNPICPEGVRRYEREAYMRRYSYIGGVCLAHGRRLGALYFCLRALLFPKCSLIGWLRHCSSIVIRAILLPYTLDCYLKQFVVCLRDGVCWQWLIRILKYPTNCQSIKGRPVYISNRSMSN
jgi:glycosyltransferase involved in cell wall biosynthesis